MWEELKKKTANHITKGKPSVLANVVRGNPWNLNLPKFGGLQTPLPSNVKLGTTPKVEKIKMPREIKEAPTKTPTPVKLGTQIVKKFNPAKPALAKGVASPLPVNAPPPQVQKMPLPQPTPDPRKSWRNMADMVIREGNKRGYHGETLARQKANESNWGKSQFARERFNYGGMGAYDSNPDNAFSYESPEKYLEAYFDLIEKDPRYKNAYKNRSNPKLYAKSLKEAGYASDPDYEWKMLNTQIYDPNE